MSKKVVFYGFPGKTEITAETMADVITIRQSTASSRLPRRGRFPVRTVRSPRPVDFVVRRKDYFINFAVG